ncbi:MAG TPA: MauE/DoxX family redox-associated membrane protein [Puia sp.]|nr:MauE/DoxX family redox-associated membrane protein [Puia sp.]
MKPYRYLANTCLFLLITLFSYTAINKLFGLTRFRFQLSLFPWLRVHPLPIALTIIGAEIGIVVLLMTPRRILIGFIAALILLSLFTTYLLIMLLTTSNLPCTCGGVLEQLSWPQHLVLNLLFMGIAILGLVSEKFSIPHK